MIRPHQNEERADLIVRELPVENPVEQPVRLRPGEFLGGSSDLSVLCRGLDAPGTALIAWSGAVRWNGGAPAAVKSLPVVFELVR